MAYSGTSRKRIQNCWCLLWCCPGFGWDTVNIPPSSYWVLDLDENNIDDTDFQLLLRNQGFFTVFHTPLMSRCAGAGREHSQAASPTWPMERFHTMDIMRSLWMRVAWGAEGSWLFSFRWVQTLFSPGVLNFFGNFTKSMILGLCDCCSGADCKSVIEWWGKLLHIVCFAYSLFLLLWC